MTERQPDDLAVDFAARNGGDGDLAAITALARRKQAGHPVRWEA